MLKRNDETPAAAKRSVRRFPDDYQLIDGIWQPISGAVEFAYSDGEAVEARLLAAVRGARDRSIFSAELRKSVSDWPSLYHLGAARANLLRPLETWLGKARVLEVGAGCGAVTRWLGEVGCDVTALEGSSRRAQIARERTAELPNVAVVCDRVQEFRPGDKYDAILLIGVLEYARVYLDGGADAQRALIVHLQEMLAPDGVIVVAIENQLGMKYFAGALEDHTGEAFFGINEQYTEKSVATFGRARLRELLGEAGLPEQAWYYPFPDYKLPVAVLAESCFDAEPLLAATLAGSAAVLDPQKPADPLFSLESAWHALAENRLVPDLANSFLILAGRSSAVCRCTESGALAWHYAIGRHPAFNKVAQFVQKPDGGIDVRRTPLARVAKPKVPLTWSVQDEQLIPGDNWWIELSRLLSRSGWTAADIADWARPWLIALARAVGADGEIANLDHRALVDGRHFDATPFNLIRDPQGSFHFIDQEWSFPGKIEFGFLIYRGLHGSLTRLTSVARPAAATPLKVSTLLKSMLAHLGILMSEQDLQRFLELELRIQKWVMGETDEDIGNISDERVLWVRGLADRNALSAQVNELAQRTAEIVQLKANLAERDAELAERDAELADIERQIAEGEVQFTTALQQVDEQGRQLTAIAERVAAQDTTLAAIAEQFSARTAELARAKAEAGDLARTIDRQQCTIDRQQRTIAELTKSSSWRLTAPLRILADRAPVARKAARGLYAASRSVAVLLVPRRLRRRWRFRHEYELIRTSGLFDAEWYLHRHVDVGTANADPIAHYIRHGAAEGRDPSPLFATAWYLQSNPDVARAGRNPLVHYIECGAAEGRPSRPFA